MNIRSFYLKVVFLSLVFSFFWLFPAQGLAATATLYLENNDGGPAGRFWSVGDEVTFRWESTVVNPQDIELYLGVPGQTVVVDLFCSTDTNSVVINGSSGSCTWIVGENDLPSGEVSPLAGSVSYPFRYAGIRLFVRGSSNTLSNSALATGFIDVNSGLSLLMSEIVIDERNDCSVETEVIFEGGTITPETASWQVWQTKRLNFTADPGYSVTSVLVKKNNGPDVPEDPPRNYLDLSCTTPTVYQVSVRFDSHACPVDPQTFNAGGVVAIDPVGPINLLLAGQSLKVSATSSIGFKIGQFLVRNYDQMIPLTDAKNKLAYTSTLTCPPTNSGSLNKGYDIKFIPDVDCQINISQTPAEGGVVTPTTTRPIILENGDNQTLTTKASAGWKIKSFAYEGESVPITDNNNDILYQVVTCDVDDVVADAGQLQQDVSVEFEPSEMFTVVASVNGNSGGNITPLGEREYDLDEEPLYTILATKGYVIEWVKIDGVVTNDYTGIILAEITMGAVEGKPIRTIEVKFTNSCEFVSPEESLRRLSLGNEAPINMRNFREWVDRNEDSVRNTIDKFQCSQILDDIGYDGVAILNDFNSTLSLNKPAIATLTFSGIKRDPVTGNDIRVILAHHAILVTKIDDISNILYNISYIDSSSILPWSPVSTGYLVCGFEVVDIDGWSTGTVFGCNVPSHWAGAVFDGVTIDKVFFRSQSISHNSTLRSLPAIRTDALNWINNNYTLIPNRGSVISPGGVCFGWSEFNARAAQLIKECHVDAGGDNKNGGGVVINDSKDGEGIEIFDRDRIKVVWPKNLINSAYVNIQACVYTVPNDKNSLRCNTVWNKTPNDGEQSFKLYKDIIYSGLGFFSVVDYYNPTSQPITSYEVRLSAFNWVDIPQNFFASVLYLDDFLLDLVLKIKSKIF